MLYDEYHQMIYPGWKPGFTQWKQRGRAVHPWHQWLAEEMPEQAKKWYMAYISAFGGLPEYWTMNYGNRRGQLAYNLRKLENRYFVE